MVATYFGYLANVVSGLRFLRHQTLWFRSKLKDGLHSQIWQDSMNRRSKRSLVLQRYSLIDNIFKIKNSFETKSNNFLRGVNVPMRMVASYVKGTFLAVMISCFFTKISVSSASVGISTEISKSPFTPLQGGLLWLLMFTLSATLHSAESAITKISPWKVKEFAEEEGEGSPFATLSANMTRLLSTILLTTTACSIYSTALFVTTLTELFPRLSLGAVTAALTAVTLFFGELLPKALAVANSELVARLMVPYISRLSTVLLPITAGITCLSDVVLQSTGMRNEEDKNVSEDMLRMVVAEAQRTEGIETGEGRMIKAVLDMQDKEVSKIMQPRIEVIGLPISASATEILQTSISTKYSRLPVYKGDVDNIVGVVFSKDLLDFMQLPEGKSPIEDCNPRMSESWSKLTAQDLMKSTYFIPETMSTWNALQEMRKRRVHMAIVVDEYGGTSGLVTFEDLLEEVVGEIYDEDDLEEETEDSRTIFIGSDGSIKMKGFAELDDVSEALGLKLEEDTLREYPTIGGLLCSLAGEIPRAGERFILSGFSFMVSEVDARRILSVEAESAEGLPDGWRGDWIEYKSNKNYIKESDSHGVIDKEDAIRNSSGEGLLINDSTEQNMRTFSPSVRQGVQDTKNFDVKFGKRDSDPSYDKSKSGSLLTSIPQTNVSNSDALEVSGTDASPETVLTFRDGEWVPEQANLK